MSHISDGAPVTPEQSIPWVIGAVAVTLLLASLNQTIVSPALPVIVGELGGLDHLTWVITAYLLAATVVAPIYGKLGDLFGRKRVLQAAILIFLAGSAICGLAGNMLTLIVGRTIQGLGGGGLMVVAMSVVADVIPPRQRGRIQGIFGAVFGIATIVGPLLGGFLVETTSWHWIFAANLPLGLLALGVISAALKVHPERRRHSIDYAGAVLLTTTLSAMVLFTSLGGTTIAWASWQSIGLVLLAIAALIGFVAVEARAKEPILPLSLFRNNVFVVSNAVGFIVGLAMFGCVTFLPLYMQTVQGVSPTNSAFAVLPMMMGMIASSLVAGVVMTRTGRYKLLPIVASASLFIGLMLLTTIGTETSPVMVGVYMLLVGMGIGPVNSVSVTAIQNAVPYNMVGVGTAGATLFRQIGGSVGVSAFGAIFAAGLAANLAGSASEGHAMSAAAIAQLPPAERSLVLEGFVSALHPVFLVAGIAAALAFIIAMFLREVPLANTLRREPESEIEAEEHATAAAVGG
ncbi:EmrB/QacA family drug resistance transporter [Devosia pacifica]|uniref:EmrB/QacA family drug resistance transporter n=1 Tax=Devosia pacifica TaxID=1335967 RepID=A0A918SDX2_9HYPH|nr:MDR family MFS transporter [Devosia pacifica]GHA35416.1 EmrB/QacA family drug resistance transporter [Devosia pacifica]